MGWLEALVKIIETMTGIFKLGKREYEENKLAKEIKDKDDGESKRNLTELLDD